MYNRKCNPLKSNSFFIFGARGTGKSTFVKEQFRPKSVLTIDLLLAEEEDRFRRDPDTLIRILEAHEHFPEWVFIDEIQKVPKLLDGVHYLIEKHQQKFILTGSSARKLKRDAANLLAGRAFVYHLHPLLPSELASDFHLETYLRWGGLPAIYGFETDLERKTYLRSYVLNYLKEEIRVEQLVRAIDPFRDFLEIAAQQSGKIINASQIARDVGVDYKTIQNYFSILEDTWLGFHLPAYHKSIRKSQLESPKFYLFDLGVKNQLSGWIDSLPSPGTSIFGHHFEEFVIQMVWRLNQYTMTDYRLSYYGTKNDVEIDLVLSKGMRELLVVEIKSNQKVDPARVKKFERNADAFDKNKQLYFVSNDPQMQKIGTVKCLHWRDFLDEVF